MVHRPLQSPCQATDALLVDGRNATVLTCWLHTSGLTTPLPILQDTARMGMRIRSMGLTSRFSPEFISWPGTNGDDLTLELVQVSLFPHLDHPNFPPNRTTNAEQWAAGIGVPAYTSDRQTALHVMNGQADAVLQSQWRVFR